MDALLWQGNFLGGIAKIYLSPDPSVVTFKLITPEDTCEGAVYIDKTKIAFPLGTVDTILNAIESFYTQLIMMEKLNESPTLQ